MALYLKVDRNCTYFGSGTRQKWLSNFAQVEDPQGLLFMGRRYRTAEHAYQSLRVCEAQRDRLAVGGDIDGIDALWKLYKPEVAQKKVNFWTAKSEPVLSGISAKMITNPVHARKMTPPLALMEPRDPMMKSVNVDELKSVWRAILNAKLEASPSFEEALYATGDMVLVEFDRGAKRTVDKGGSVFWTGLVKDGVLYGENFMGKMMMMTRDENFNYQN